VKPDPPPVTLPPPSDPPKLYAGKYKTVEEMEKGYQELQKLHSKPKGPLDAEAPVNPFAADDFTPAAVLSRVGLTEEQVYEQVTANGGKMPADLYAKFKTAGAGKGLVDDYFATRVAVRAQLTAKAKEDALKVAGGQKQLDTLMEWGKGLPDGVKASLNTRLMDPAQHAAAVVELKGHYEQAVAGGAAAILEGSPARAPGAGYDSFPAMQAAKRDPRYRSDPIYRKEVFRRLALTPQNITGRIF